MSARVVTWLGRPANGQLQTAIERLAASEDVVHVAVMPDAHVAEEVCVGTVTATTRRILPACVGGDLGCGMVALRFDAEADRLRDREAAAALLDALYLRIPHRAHRAAAASVLPAALADEPLSAPSLETAKRREGRLELGTLGRGNHFVELQRAEDGALWALVHSGSRAMGPMIRQHHEARAERDRTGLAFLEADSAAGRAYLSDLAWASAYARASRTAMLEAVVDSIGEVLRVDPDPGTRIEVDHNHVRREEHQGRELWVHRKGAMGLAEGALGVLPGSMGTATFHVAGRGNADALGSSAHGAGRALSRGEARRTIRARQVSREMRGVWFDRRLEDALREEAPSAYNDVEAVMRAGRELVRILRRLDPVLVFKGV